MTQIFGEFIEDLPQDSDALELSFTSSSRSIPGRWENNRLSAHFIADYVANLLPVDEEDSLAEDRINVSKDAVAYVGNELLENAMKFNEIKESKVKFGIHLLAEIAQYTAVICTVNTTTKEKAREFQAVIKELLSADLNELYVQQIEKTASSEDSEASGLGLITAINDYSAKLGWKFAPEPNNAEIVTVTTMAQISV